jgi:multicomponent K+:H+ antiporter subunit A
LILLIVLLPLLAGTLLTAWSGYQQAPGHRSRTAWLAAAVTASSLGLLLYQAPSVLAGEAYQTFTPWVPEIGLNLGFKLDALSLMFGLLITGMGLLVVVYAHS